MDALLRSRLKEAAYFLFSAGFSRAEVEEILTGLKKEPDAK